MLDRPKPTVGFSANGRGRRRRRRKRIRRWRQLVADREKWKDIVGQAKTHSGL